MILFSFLGSPTVFFFYLSSSCSFSKAALDRAASPAKASTPRCELLAELAELCDTTELADVYVEVRGMAAGAILLLDRLCRTADGDLSSCLPESRKLN
jgi:hypothetical protein